MRAVLLAAMALAACKPADRGACLRSHRVPEFAQLMFIQVDKVMVPMTIVHSAYDQCDRWQYPNGKGAA